MEAAGSSSKAGSSAAKHTSTSTATDEFNPLAGLFAFDCDTIKIVGRVCWYSSFNYESPSFNSNAFALIQFDPT